MTMLTNTATFDEKKKARRGLVIYFTVLIIGTAILEGLLLRAGDSIRNHLGLVLPLMWMPAFASFVARLVLKEGIRDVSFRFGGKMGLKILAIGWLFPVAVGMLAYGLAWSLGLADFSKPLVPGFSGINSAILAFIVLLLIRATIGTAIVTIAAAGEEIGWRGYMLTRMIKAGVPRPLLTSGIIWGLWHVPLILGGVYVTDANPVTTAIIFLITITAFGYFLGALRLASGSVWPAIIGHSAWNAIIQGAFDFSSAGSQSKLWIGESGLLVAAATILVVWLFVKKFRLLSVETKI